MVVLASYYGETKSLPENVRFARNHEAISLYELRCMGTYNGVFRELENFLVELRIPLEAVQSSHQRNREHGGGACV